MTKRLDKELGLNQPITRRDFVYGSSLLLGGAIIGSGNASNISKSGGNYSFELGSDWYGPGGIGDYSQSHGNTPGLIKTAHEIRSGRFKSSISSAVESRPRTLFL